MCKCVLCVCLCVCVCVCMCVLFEYLCLFWVTVRIRRIVDKRVYVYAIVCISVCSNARVRACVYELL